MVVYLTTLIAWAAEPPLSVSFEEALILALTRSEPLAIASARVERAHGGVTEARSSGLPQLDGTASYEHTFASEFDSLIADSAARDGPVDAFGDLPFGQEDAWRCDLTLVQLLFAGGEVRARTAAAVAELDTAELQRLAERAVVAMNASRAYLDAELSSQIAMIADDTLLQAERTLAQTRVAVDVGALPEFEFLRASVDRDARRQDRVRAARNQTLAMLQLRQLLDVPPDTPLALTTPLSVEAISPSAASDLVDLPEATEARVPVRTDEAAVDVARATLRATRARGWPTVQAHGRAGVVAWPTSPLPPVAPGAWRDNVIVGVSVDIPLFTGFRIRGAVRAATADVLARTAQLALTRELAALDSATAVADVAAAEAIWSSTARTEEEADRAYAIAEVRFQEGIATQLELSASRLQLAHARANRASAARDLLLARIRVALLPALPIQATAATLPQVFPSAPIATPAIRAPVTSTTAPWLR